jgi:phosphate transport system permease protein
MIWTVILPYARPGIIGGCFLALGRALGETMAVVMLIGNVPAIESAFTGKGATIASIIANGLNNVNSELQRSALVELALILLLVTICINALARILIWRMGARRGTSGFVGNLLRRVTNKTPTLNGTAAPALQTPQRLNANPWAQTEDKVMTGVLATCLVVTCGPLFLILGYILFAGASSINLDFFYLDAKGNPPNDPFAFYEKPDGEPRLGQGNALVGTAILVALSTLGAVPIGILAAIFLVEFRRSRLAPVVRFVGELLGGVPSIVLGILGYGLLVRPPAWLAEVSPFHGFSGWAGIFALGVMMIPIIMRSSEESMKLVPQSLRNASYALGAEYWQTITRVTVPAALPAIVTGVFLAMARIAGETAPLLLTANNSDGWVFWPGQPMPYLTYWIYNGAGDPRVPYQNLGWAAAVVLLIFVMVLNIGIRLASGKRLVTAGGTD